MDGQECILLIHFWGPFNFSSGYGPLHKQCGRVRRWTPESALLLCSCVILGRCTVCISTGSSFKWEERFHSTRLLESSKQDSNCESTWPQARPLGGTLTCWFKKYSGRQGRVWVSQNSPITLSPSSLDRDLSFRREDEQFRELKIELQ